MQKSPLTKTRKFMVFFVQSCVTGWVEGKLTNSGFKKKGVTRQPTLLFNRLLIKIPHGSYPLVGAMVLRK